MAVRREAVRLSLEDDFSRQMLAAAASTKTLEGALRSLDGTSVRTSDSLDSTTGSNDSLSRSATQSMATIDRYSGRMGLLLKTAAALGPALVPIGAVGVAGVAGLASQLGFATLGMSSLLIAAQGVGDAVKAVNEARLDPTIENIQKAREALEGLDPAAQAFVQRFQEFRPVLADIRNAAAAGFFPGLIDSLDSFERIAPDIADLMQVLGTTGGNLISEAAESLAGPEWSQFLAFLEREAPRAFEELGHTVGNLARGMAELWMAFTPLNQDFSSWMLDASRGFAEWADGLSQTEGFEEFVAYMRENGPLVADATTAIANAILQIVQAAAPLGGPVLKAITGIADAFATIADSPLGTPIMAAVTAMSALSLATNVATAAVTRLNASMALLGVTSKSTAAASVAASSATAAGGVAGAAGRAGLMGGIAGMAARLTPVGITLGLLDTAPDYIQNLQMMASGERDVVEGMARMAAGATPVGAALNLLGVDVLGVNDKAGSLGSRLAETARDAVRLGEAAAAPRVPIRRLSGDLAEWQRGMLRGVTASDRLKASLEEQRAEARETAAAWGDYSQKVKLGGDIGIEDVIRRMNRLSEASENFAENIRTALDKGVEPSAIRSMVRMLGRDGAAGVLQDLADAGKDTRRDLNEAFSGMNRGTRGVRNALGEVNEAIHGTQEEAGDLRDRLNDLNGLRPKPKADLDISDLVSALNGAENGINALDRKKPEPNADLNYGPLLAGVNAAENLVMRLNGVSSRSTAYIDTIRTTYFRTVHVPGAGAGGLGPVGSADGGTVPKTGRGYADRHPYLLADGEEIISNRFGQADRHRALLKAINANRIPTLVPRVPVPVSAPVSAPAPHAPRPFAPERSASRASERRMDAATHHAPATVVIRDRFPDKVTLRVGNQKFDAYVDGIARDSARDENAQDRNFARQQGYGRG